ncbi:regulatory protein RecX [Actinoplanes sp. NPDC049599]|uniref:regulatory protein RecX n=1 Tax=Actinoplanes sp. NPDC049599 TaxID=3363903 RepID=UPI0037B4EBF9
MAGRRGARSGRGWDAIPPRPASDDPPDGELRPDDPERGNVAGRRRRSSPAGASSGAFGASGSRPFGNGNGNGNRSGNRAGSGGGGRSAKDTTDRPSEAPRSESEIARDICLRQLAVRPRTRAELAKVLARKEISEEVIAEVLDRYDEVGIIDDAAFARMWVSTRHQGRGLARRALANELRQHGVESEVATEALETLDDEAEATTARALVDRKLRSARGTPDQVFRRLVGMLARKGYPAGVAIQAVKEALASRDEEAAAFADQIDADALADEATDSLS